MANDAPGDGAGRVVSFDELCELAESQARRDSFDSHWRQQEGFANCDAIGSTEYHRIFREWIEGGCERLVGRFIYVSANRSFSEK